MWAHAYLCVCKRGGVFVCITVHVWKSKENLEESILFSYYISYKDPTQAVKLDSKLFYLLRKLTSPASLSKIEPQ